VSEDLPEGWSSTLLPEVVYFAGRIGWRGLKAEEYTQAGAILLSVYNLNNGPNVDFSEVNYVSTERYEESPEIKVRHHDVLLTKDGAGIGKAGFVASLPGRATINSSLLLLRSFGAIDPKFLFYSLIGPRMQGLVKDRITGSTTPHLFQKDIRQFELVIPPLAEQQRIVAKLEALLARVNAARQQLAKVPAILKRFRQSVLAAACSGRLTAEWRDAKEMPDIGEGMDMPDVPVVPPSWTWKPLSSIAQTKGGVTKGRRFNGKQTIMLPYLRVANVQDGFLDLAEIKEIEVLPEDRDKYSLQSGDVLFTEGGDRDKLGRGTVWRGEIPGCIHQNHIFRARLTTSDAIPEYISLATKSDFSRNYFFHNASQTVNLASLNLTMLSGLPIPLPPLPEQHVIVRRVDALFRLADAIEKRVAAATARAEKLTQAILAKAFRGQLVPTEAELARREGRDYEPASALLKRTRKKKDEESAGDNKAKRIVKSKKSDGSKRSRGT
jgi:type I restriction enzyme S subunit